MGRIQGVLFDKDGTLFDFDATWSDWAAETLTGLADGDATHAAELGARIGFHMDTRKFDPGSAVIAGTPEDIGNGLAPALPHMTPAQVIDRLNAAAAMATQVPAVPLLPLLSDLRGLGLRLGVATNDAEAPARAHLASARIDTAFDFVAGYDSGHGGKPAPGMCLAFARSCDLAPDSVVMVGDSTHDMIAGRAAGMHCVAVLTGMAGHDELFPHADVVLDDIGGVPDWIRSQIT